MKFKKKYDQAKPPLERLLDMKILSLTKEQELIQLRERTNPMLLRQLIENLIIQVQELPVLNNLEVVNIFDTLIMEEDPSVTLSFEPMMPAR